MGLIHPQATTEDITQDHILGLNAYDIATKYGMNEDEVAVIIRELEAEGAFVPKPKEETKK